VTTFFGIYFSLVIVYMFGALVLYWWDSTLYWDNLGKVRRTFYVLFLILLFIGISQRYMAYGDWKGIGVLAAVAVFIDLAVFQTPNILKIMNTEFQQEDEVRRIIHKNKNALQQSIHKVRAFSEVVQFTDAHFDQKALPRSWDEYRDQLKDYLKLYSDSFDFRLSFFPFLGEDLPEDREASFRQVIQNIERRHNKDFTPEERASHIRSFVEGKAASLDDDKLIAIPYYGEFHNFVVTAEAEEPAIDWIDASHLLNLLSIFEWFMSDADSDADDETEEEI
jgi:hypothetical protein